MFGGALLVDADGVGGRVKAPKADGPDPEAAPKPELEPNLEPEPEPVPEPEPEPKAEPCCMMADEMASAAAESYEQLCMVLRCY